MKCMAKDFEGTAKLLGSEVWMESEEDLDDLGRTVAALFVNCTHPFRC